MPTRDEKVDAPTRFGKPKGKVATVKGKAKLVHDAVASTFTEIEAATMGAEAPEFSMKKSDAIKDHLVSSERLADVAYRAALGLAGQQVLQKALNPDEVEMQALMDSIDQRLVEIHQQIDRVLARWDNG